MPSNTRCQVVRGSQEYIKSNGGGACKPLCQAHLTLEADEREGLVRDYLDTLLPDKWESMDLFERRNYLNGTGLADIGLKGQVKRTAVCNMEIWCECFGKERANLKRIDSNELASILIRLDWQRLPNKVRTGLYGPQYIFVPKDCS